jgi:hypothetical protein
LHFGWHVSSHAGREFNVDSFFASCTCQFIALVPLFWRAQNINVSPLYIIAYMTARRGGCGREDIRENGK